MNATQQNLTESKEVFLDNQGDVFVSLEPKMTSLIRVGRKEQDPSLGAEEDGK